GSAVGDGETPGIGDRAGLSVGACVPSAVGDWVREALGSAPPMTPSATTSTSMPATIAAANRQTTASRFTARQGLSRVGGGGSGGLVYAASIDWSAWASAFSSEWSGDDTATVTRTATGAPVASIELWQALEIRSANPAAPASAVSGSRTWNRAFAVRATRSVARAPWRRVRDTGPASE